MCSAVTILTYLKPTALELHNQSMLTSCSQCLLNVILGRCSDELMYDNARVSVEMTTGGLVRLLEAVPASIQNIDVDAVADQEERSPVDHRRRSRQRSVLMADLERLLWPVKARSGEKWLVMVVTDGSTVGMASVSGLGSRYEL